MTFVMMERRAGATSLRSIIYRRDHNPRSIKCLCETPTLFFFFFSFFSIYRGSMKVVHEGGPSGWSMDPFQVVVHGLEVSVMYIPQFLSLRITRYPGTCMSQSFIVLSSLVSLMPMLSGLFVSINSFNSSKCVIM